MITLSILFGIVYVFLIAYLGIGKFLMFKLPSPVIDFLEVAPYPIILLILSYFINNKKTWLSVGGVFLIGLGTAILASFLTAFVWTVIVFC